MQEEGKLIMMYEKIKKKTGWLVGSALALMTVLSISHQAAGQSVSSLNGAGATFPYPLYSKWFDEYARKAGVQINYQSIGSGGGIQQLKARTVDFGASDAPLSDSEAQEMPAPVVHIPTVAGAVVIAYNLPGVGQGLRLDAATVAGIFLGQITRWNDPKIAALNPGKRLPGTPIAVAHRSDGSGTTYIFTHYLAAVSPAWKTRVGAGKSVRWPTGIGGKGNEGVAGIIRQAPGGVGYVELAYAIQNRLSHAAIKNRAGKFITPSIQSTTAAAAGAVGAMKKDIRVSIVDAKGANAYPIAGFTYILVYKNQSNPAKGRALVRFLHWAMRDGQKYAAPLHYAPLPRETVALNERAIKSIK